MAWGYGVVAVVLVIVGAVGIYNFLRLGHAVDTILANNYESIRAAENMKEALERQDSAAAFLMAGHPNRARGQFAANSPKFSREFQIGAVMTTKSLETAQENRLSRRGA